MTPAVADAIDTASPPPLHVEARLVPIELLVSGDNPRRKQPDPTYISDLARSMAPPIGMIEPIVCRLHPKRPEQLQIVCGETRFKAAKEAALTHVPVVVKSWDDDTVLLVQLVENIQRASMHPIDEGEAFKRLIDRKKHTAETLAKTIGKSIRWVYNRLEFTKLIAPLREAFLQDEITVSHAELLARLEPADQVRCHEDGLWRTDYLGLVESGQAREERRSVVSVRDLDAWIEGQVRLAIHTTAVQRLIPEIDDAQVEAQATSARILQVTTDSTLPHNPELRKRFEGVLTSHHWKRAGGKSACEHAEKAVIVVGYGQGEVLDVCVAKKKCAKHWPDHQPEAVEARQKARAKASSVSPSVAQRIAEQEEQRRREEAAEARWNKLGPAIKAAVAARVKAITKVQQPILNAALKQLQLPQVSLAALPKMLLVHAHEERNYRWEGFEKETLAWAKSLGVDVKAVEASITPKAEGEKSQPSKRKAGKKR